MDMDILLKAAEIAKRIGGKKISVPDFKKYCKKNNIDIDDLRRDNRQQRDFVKHNIFPLTREDLYTFIKNGYEGFKEQNDYSRLESNKNDN